MNLKLLLHLSLKKHALSLYFDIIFKVQNRRKVEHSSSGVFLFHNAFKMVSWLKKLDSSFMI